MKIKFFYFLMLSALVISCRKNENITPIQPGNAKDLQETDYKGTDNILDGVFNVKGCLTITANAQLTIKRNSKLIFDSNTGILVEEKGILTIEGEAGNVVTLTGKEAIEGYWQGVIFEGSLSTKNKIAYCNLEYAGSTNQNCATFDSEKAALVLGVGKDRTGLISLDHLNINKSKENAIYINPGFEVTMKDCNVNSSKGFPVKIDFKNADVLSDNDSNNSFAGVGTKNYVLIQGGQFGDKCNSDLNIKKLNIPYLIYDDFSINAIVNVGEGTIFAMGQNALIDLDNIASNVNGQLICNGTSASPIVFKGLEAIPNYWDGIDVSVAKLTLNNVQLSDAGSTADSFYGGENAMITLSRYYEKVTKASIKNCKFSNYGSNYGIQVKKETVPGGNNVKVEYNTDIETSNSFTGAKKVLFY